MWLAVMSILAAPASAASWQDWSPIIVAALALLSAVGAAFLAMRGTFRTSDAQREAAFEAAVDKDRATLRDERDRIRAALDAAIAERDSYRERYAQLRIAVREKGFDPDNLSGGSGAAAP